MSDIAVTLEARFASVQTQFALLGGELRGFADAGKNQASGLENNIKYMQWKLNLIGSAILGLIGLGVYGIKQLMKFYIPQIAPKISPPTATETVEKSTREAAKGDVGGKDAGREGKPGGAGHEHDSTKIVGGKNYCYWHV
ncbi:hypothetical protein HOY82DRAFT_594028 [Tuber indicum]|nr:hypothetical protein HOY82DRAFT_594028 [Tuber indicum]